jgi:antitoxin CptB
MKELDVLFARYLEYGLPTAPAAERAAFEALLEVQDPMIYAYCFGQLPVPEDYAGLIRGMTGLAAAP